MTRGVRAGNAVLGIATIAGLAPAPAHAAFERAPCDIPAAARGGLVATSDDAVWGNAARAVVMSERRPPDRPDPTRGCVTFLGSRPFGLAELSEIQAGVVAVLRSVAIGGGVRRFGAEFYAEREARLVVSGGRSGTAVGAALRGLEVGGEGFTTIRSLVIDASVAARAGNVEIGAALEGVVGSAPGDPTGSSRRAALGISRRLVPALDLALEIQRRGNGPLGPVVGVAWYPVPPLALYGGARQEPPALAGGLSVGRPGLRVDASFDRADPLGTTLRLGVRLGLGGVAGASEAQFAERPADAGGDGSGLAARRDRDDG